MRGLLKCLNLLVKGIATESVYYTWINLCLQVQRSRNKQMREMFPDGFGIHHAGMLRQDRTLMENMFSRGYLKVLVCTATLAWGVNLPAHAVIIKVRNITEFCPCAS